MTIAETISEAFANGIPHPGYPDTDQPPTTIRLPLFRVAGMPPEVYETVNETVKMIGEGVVHTIETVGASTIILTADLAALRADLAAAQKAAAANESELAALRVEVAQLRGEQQ